MVVPAANRTRTRTMRTTRTTLEMRTLRRALVLAVAATYLLHQDVWFWETARPLVFGFLPIGLFYHAAYSAAAAGLMALLVRYAWPAELEREAEADDAPPEGRRPEDGSPGGAAR